MTVIENPTAYHHAGSWYLFYSGYSSVHLDAGAMDIYRAKDGRPWGTWNDLSDAGGRKSCTGRLVITGTGAGAGFTVAPA